jgi:membrane protease YdiL (CAAX protease family)
MDIIMRIKAHKTIGKILSFPVLKIIIGIILINVGIFILESFVQLTLSALSITNDLIKSSSIFFIRIIALYYLYRLFIWIYEKRKPIEITFKKNIFKQIIWGSLIGLLCLSFIVGFNWLFGWISIESVNESPEILKGIYYTIFFVFLQDIVFFLILFRITEKYLGTYLTILITSIVFGFEHFIFPEYSFISGIFLFINIAFIFSALYLKSRTIWEIFGFHVVYNFIQNVVLGNFAIEGIQSVFKLHIEGPVFFTGDKSGFETSIFAVLYCVLIGGYFLIKENQNGMFLKPFWIKENKTSHNTL